MKFFPPGGVARGEVLSLLTLLAASIEDLEWFRRTLRDRVAEWPGLAELRAIYCTSRKPADGDEGAGYSTVAGFTPGEIERENIEAPRDSYLRLGAGATVRQIAAGVPELPAPAAEAPRAIRTRPLPDPETELRRADIAAQLDKVREERAREIAQRDFGPVKGGAQ